MATPQPSSPAMFSLRPSFSQMKRHLPISQNRLRSAPALVFFLFLSTGCLVEFVRLAAAIGSSGHNAAAFDALQHLAAFVATLVGASAAAVLFYERRRAQHASERATAAALCAAADQQGEEFHHALIAAEQKFNTLLNCSSEGYLLIEDTRIVDCSRSILAMLRLESKDQIAGRCLSDFARHLQPGGESSVDLLKRCYELKPKDGNYRFNCVYSRQDGAELHVDACCAAVTARGKKLLVVAWRDLTERRESEEALLRSAARLRVAQAIAHLGHWEYDARADRVIWSEEALRILGFASPTESPTLQSCFHRIHPEDRASAESAFAAAIRRGMPVEIYFRILLPDGNIRHVDSRSRSDLNAAGKAVRVSGTILDITEQKQVEARLRQTLGEKELLVKEVHHRVKNNLQVISSLLSMQIDLLEDEDSIQALRESQHRISSMALIHERLYSHGNIADVDFAEYTETLVQELFHAYGKQAQHIYKSLDLAPVPLNIEKAIPCGLILNELVTNALKHAFPSGRGTLSVTLKSQPNERISLCVSDSGIGLPEDLNLRDSKSLGLPLVEVLARQLGGVLHVQSKPGATFTVEFPILE